VYQESTDSSVSIFKGRLRGKSAANGVTEVFMLISLEGVRLLAAYAHPEYQLLLGSWDIDRMRLLTPLR